MKTKLFEILLEHFRFPDPLCSMKLRKGYPMVKRQPPTGIFQIKDDLGKKRLVDVGTVVDENTNRELLDTWRPDKHESGTRVKLQNLMNRNRVRPLTLQQYKSDHLKNTLLTRRFGLKQKDGQGGFKFR